LTDQAHVPWTHAAIVNREYMCMCVNVFTQACV
jgi:hypothetical protein